VRLALALAFSLAFPIPGGAQAHCFKVWRYPRAQRCEITRPPVVRIATRAAAPTLQVKPSSGPSFDATVKAPFDIPLTDPDPATMALRELLK